MNDTTETDLSDAGRALAGRAVIRAHNGIITACDDELVVEEPLEIRIGSRRFSATMRTPQGEALDMDLARGLLFSEGVIHGLDDIASLKLCDIGEAASPVESSALNVVRAELRRSHIEPHLWARNIISNSSCGLCGKASLEALRQKLAPLPDIPCLIPAETLLALPDTMRPAQPLFGRTGGLHAAALFRPDGTLLVCREDIGRHNAVDKVLGWGLATGFIPAAEPLVLLCSGRASFEIVQKALVARIAIIASVSAASSLAVDLAVAHKAILVGFLRPNGFTVYAGRERLG